MMSIDESFAKAHIGKWINSWNTHDLKAIISFTLKISNLKVLK
jgi:uncharacterized protein YjaZ